MSFRRFSGALAIVAFMNLFVGAFMSSDVCADTQESSGKLEAGDITASGILIRLNLVNRPSWIQSCLTTSATESRVDSSRQVESGGSSCGPSDERLILRRLVVSQNSCCPVGVGVCGCRFGRVVCCNNTWGSCPC